MLRQASATDHRHGPRGLQPLISSVCPRLQIGIGSDLLVRRG